MLKRVLLSTAFALLAAVAASAQTHLAIPEENEKALSPQCSAGVVYDDGGFTDGYSLGDGDPNDATMVMKFDLPAGTTRLDQACVCFARGTTAPASMNFDIVVYDDNGPGGQPGTFVGAVTAAGATFPSPDTPTFFSVNLTSTTLTLPDNTVYIGARWPGGAFVMCGDRSAGTAQRQNYGSANNGLSWTSVSSTFPSAPPRAMGIRVDTATPAGGTGCTADALTLCLNNDRYEVRATFQTPDGQAGNAQVVKLTADTGYFWFFSATNVEAVLKVLDGCAVNSRYWVFAGGLTNVRTVITVRDTLRNVTKTYVNPQNTAFQPIQDTNAFATCP